jgi:hypothetical protein
MFKPMATIRNTPDRTRLFNKMSTAVAITFMITPQKAEVVSCSGFRDKAD